jgi:hypothetical protein
MKFDFREWRGRVGELTGRHKPITQETAAQLLGCSAQQYYRLEKAKDGMVVRRVWVWACIGIELKLKEKREKDGNYER